MVLGLNNLQSWTVPCKYTRGLHLWHQEKPQWLILKDTHLQSVHAQDRRLVPKVFAICTLTLPWNQQTKSALHIMSHLQYFFVSQSFFFCRKQEFRWNSPWWRNACRVWTTSASEERRGHGKMPLCLTRLRYPRLLSNTQASWLLNYKQQTGLTPSYPIPICFCLNFMVRRPGSQVDQKHALRNRDWRSIGRFFWGLHCKIQRRILFREHPKHHGPNKLGRTV